MDLTGRVALVTGGSHGIGSAIAQRLANAGVDVAVGYGRDRLAAEGLAKSLRALGPRSVAVGGDLSDPKQVVALVEATESNLGSIDILVSNAGIGPRQALADISVADWDKVMDVNLRASFILAQRVIPGMCDRGWGRIVLVSSAAAFTGGLIGPHYAASKAGQIGLVHALAGLVAPHGVTVNAVAPALIADTGMMQHTPEMLRQIAQQTMVKRLGRPEEVAQAVLLILTNAYITAQTILVDGGVYPR